MELGFWNRRNDPVHVLMTIQILDIPPRRRPKQYPPSTGDSQPLSLAKYSEQLMIVHKLNLPADSSIRSFTESHKNELVF